MDDVDFVPASQDVALAELRRLHADGKIRRGDYFLILQALIPGGGLLDSMLGRRIAAAQRIQGLAALDRVAHQSARGIPFRAAVRHHRAGREGGDTAMSARADLIRLAEQADDMPGPDVAEQLARLTPGMSTERRLNLWRIAREATAELRDLDFNPVEALCRHGIESSCPVAAQELRDHITRDLDWALAGLLEPERRAA